MSEASDKKPCLVKTGQGFSVQYKERLLYSKYNPQKNILSLVDSLEIPEGTVILCLSPVLCYGLEKLLAKMPENCLLICAESDKNLYSLFCDNLKNMHFCNKKLIAVKPEKLDTLPEYLSINNRGRFRRCIKIDFSGGAEINRAFYENLYEACQNAIGQFWKNRVTLIKFGRRYSANFLRNLQLLSKSIKNVKTDQPILVTGAGESALETLCMLKPYAEHFFIIAVDAALPTLKSLNIRPNAVVCEESQDIIADAFTGCRNWYDYLFAGLSTNPNVTRLCPQKNVFHTTEFCSAGFIDRAKKEEILPDFIAPLGSVGLVAVQAALKTRESEEIPVFVTGMDFSYSPGCTHLKDSLHERMRRIYEFRLNQGKAFAGSFGSNSIIADSELYKVSYDKNELITTASLMGYAKLFNYVFKGTPNLFDAGLRGIKLELPALNPITIIKSLKPNKASIRQEKFFCDNETLGKEKNTPNYDTESKIHNFIYGEINALKELKDIFTGKITLSENEKKSRITELLESREYLYLHFPDGYQLNLTQPFLNRIRIEIEYFLKILKK